MSTFLFRKQTKTSEATTMVISAAYDIHSTQETLKAADKLPYKIQVHVTPTQYENLTLNQVIQVVPGNWFFGRSKEHFISGTGKGSLIKTPFYVKVTGKML